LIDTGLKGVSVSLDGPTAKVHDRIRGVPGAFRRTLKGLTRLVEVNARRGGKTKVRVNTVLTRYNYTYLPEIVKLAGELGCADVIPLPVDDRGARRVRLSKAQLLEYNEFIAPQVGDLRQRYGFSLTPELLFPYGTTPEDLKLARRGAYARRYFKHHPCYAPWLHLFIGWSGDVYLCCMARGKTSPLGNVCGQCVRDLFTGPIYQRIREQFLQQRPKVCHRCDNFLAENRLLEKRLQNQ
jgi:MoaA/NifB/PqqE/SkfB family radical SAM enzyme